MFGCLTGFTNSCSLFCMIHAGLYLQEDIPLYSKLKAIAASGVFTLSPMTAAALSGAFLPGLLPTAWAGQAKIRSALHMELLP